MAGPGSPAHVAAFAATGACPAAAVGRRPRRARRRATTRRCSTTTAPPSASARARKHLGWYIDRAGDAPAGAPRRRSSPRTRPREVLAPARRGCFAERRATEGGMSVGASQLARAAGRPRLGRGARRAAASGPPRPAATASIDEANTAARGLLPGLDQRAPPASARLFRALRQPAPVADRPGARARRARSTNTASTSARRGTAASASSTSTPRRSGRGARTNVVVVLQERTMADKIDRQLTHRGAARTVTGLASMLAHEIKNPLSGIRGAAQLLESSVGDERPDADPPHLRRGRPHREARRPHGGLLRRAADRARAGQHPRRARPCAGGSPQSGFARTIRDRRRIRSRRCRRSTPTATSSSRSSSTWSRTPPKRSAMRRTARSC